MGYRGERPAWDARPSTNPSRITIPSGEGGIYEVSLAAEGGDTTSVVSFWIKRNGSQVGPTFTPANSSANQKVSAQLHFLLSLSATDYVESGISHTLINGYALRAASRFSALKVG